jgi:hypothetical protein
MAVACGNMVQSKERVRKIVVLLGERRALLWAILAKPCGWRFAGELAWRRAQRENHSLFRAALRISSRKSATTAYAVNGA